MNVLWYMILVSAILAFGEVGSDYGSIRHRYVIGKYAVHSV